MTRELDQTPNVAPTWKVMPGRREVTPNKVTSPSSLIPKKAVREGLNSTYLRGVVISRVELFPCLELYRRASGGVLDVERM